MPVLVASFVLAGAGAVLYNITAISLMQTLDAGAPARPAERDDAASSSGARSRSARSSAARSPPSSACRATLWVGGDRRQPSASCRSRSRRSATSARCRPSRSTIPARRRRADACVATRRCLSCPRWRPGAASSTSRCARSRSSGRAGAHRDAEDVRPAAVGARRAAVRRSRAARKAAAVPDRGAATSCSSST